MKVIKSGKWISFGNIKQLASDILWLTMRLEPTVVNVHGLGLTLVCSCLLSQSALTVQ